MRIRIILPSKVILDKEADKITAPGAEGSFQILPRHIDFVSSLKSGILTVFSEGEVLYYAINQGILVKQAEVVSVSCLQAVKGPSLENLASIVADTFKELHERERKTNEILLKLETDMLRLFIEMDATEG
jgi:F-type H+-transporting ATPase subunit epsilon